MTISQSQATTAATDSSTDVAKGRVADPASARALRARKTRDIV